MEKKTAIEFKNVSKVYKLYKNDKQRFRAIFNKRIKPKLKKATDNVSFTIKEGESMITGVAYPSSGEITVNGRVSALLELTAGFDPEFTGRENIYFRGQLLGIDEKEVKAMEEEIIDFADLGDYIDQPVRTYSSGMKSRLGFAINANIKPEILIVDEALSVGDKEFRQKCNKKINEIVDTGATFLFVTHSTGVARNFCKRGIVLKMGRIIFDGDIDDAIGFYEDFLQKARETRMSKESQKVLG